MNGLSPTSVESALGRLDRAFIDGKYVAAATGAKLTLINPSSGRLLSEAAACDATDVDRAVESASWMKPAIKNVFLEQPLLP